jgi:hypothetical protein
MKLAERALASVVENAGLAAVWAKRCAKEVKEG